MKWTDKYYLEELGKNIAKKRKEGGMSQADLAYKIGMEVPNLSVIENGSNRAEDISCVECAFKRNLTGTYRSCIYFEGGSGLYA
jgi:ribosome-binding protein aMBF1 (putative translation factor)